MWTGSEVDPPVQTPLVRFLGTGCGRKWLSGAGVAGPKQQQQGMDSGEGSSWGTPSTIPGEDSSPGWGICNEPAPAYGPFPLPTRSWSSSVWWTWMAPASRGLGWIM